MKRVINAVIASVGEAISRLIAGDCFVVRLGGLLAMTLILCSSIARAETVSLDLDQAIDRAMLVNYDINNAKERLSELRSKIGEVRGSALPQLTATFNYQRNFKRPEIFLGGQTIAVGSKNTYTSSVVLNQSLYSAGKVFKAVKAARNETENTLQTLEDVKDEISFQVKNLFYEILYADKTIEITKKTLKQLTSHLSSIRTRYNQGLESDYALMRQEVEVSNIKPQISFAEQTRVVYVNALKNILALSAGDEILLAGELKFENKMPLPPKDDLILKALANRNDLAATKAHVKALQQNVGIERGGYLPTLGLTSNLTWQGQTDDFIAGKNERYYAFNAGLLFSLPIFDGLKTHYRIREARSELKIASTDELKLKANITSEVLNALSAFESAKARENNQRAALSLAQKAVSIASLRFGQGFTSQIELNDTIISRDQSEKIYAQAVYDCLVAEADLARVIGGEL